MVYYVSDFNQKSLGKISMKLRNNQKFKITPLIYMVGKEKFYFEFQS